MIVDKMPSIKSLKYLLISGLKDLSCDFYNVSAVDYGIVSMITGIHLWNEHGYVARIQT